MQSRVIEFSNDFHNTSSSARAKPIRFNSGRECWRIRERVMRRVERDLCGVENCSCGGLRGRQEDPLAAEMWEAYQICKVARLIGYPRRRLGEYRRTMVLS